MHTRRGEAFQGIARLAAKKSSKYESDIERLCKLFPQSAVKVNGVPNGTLTPSSPTGDVPMVRKPIQYNGVLGSI